MDRKDLENAYLQGKIDATARLPGRAISRGWHTKETYDSYYEGYTDVLHRGPKLVQGDLFE